MCTNSLKVSKCALEENLLSSSHRAQDAENQGSFIRLAELQQKFKSQPLRVWAVTGKEQDPVNWNGNVWKDPTTDENFGPSDSQGVITPEEALSPPRRYTSIPKPLRHCLFHLWLRKSLIVYWTSSDFPWTRCQVRWYWCPPGPIKLPLDL